MGRRALRISGGMLRVAFSPPRRLAVLKALATFALALPPVRRRVALAVSGIGLAYPRPKGSHPLVGRRADEAELGGGLREALRDGTFVLVTARPTDAQESAHLRIVEARDRGTPTALARPDGYVAWAADDPAPAVVRAALAGWDVSA